MPTLIERLAQRALAIEFDALSPEVVARGKALVLDTLGCALGAVDSDVMRSLYRVLAAHGGAPHATVVGTPWKTDVGWATLVNGSASRALDANDYYFGRDPAHPSGDLSALLAVGEARGASGRDLIAALAAAYDLHLAFADAAGVPNLWDRGWHHGTNAQFAASAAAARLMGGDAATVAHAMAIAGSHHNTLAQLQSGTISKLKATAEAWVAKGAVEAALLATHGITGPLDLIEGRFGFAACVAGGIDVDTLMHARADRFLDVSVKPYPAVATAMAPIDAALEIARQYRPAPHEIESLTVRLPRFALATPSGSPERRHPQSRESADHSFYFCAAVALVDGACGDAQFAEQRLRDPVLHAVLERTELIEDAAFTAAWPGSAGGAIELVTSDGRVLEARRPYPPGHPHNPLSSGAAADKFHAHADPLLGRERAIRAAAAIDELDACTDLRDLMPLFAAPRAEP